jgi:hypothetical protein
MQISKAIETRLVATATTFTSISFFSFLAFVRPTMLMPEAIPWLLASGLGFGVLALWLWLRLLFKTVAPVFGRIKNRLSKTKHDDNLGQKITLREAAIKAYEATQEGSMHAQFAEGTGDIHSYYSYVLCKDENNQFCIPVYGVKPPSSRVVVIPEDYLRDGEFEKEATALKPHYLNAPRYEQLQINRADFEKRLDVLVNSYMGKPSGNR